MTQTTERPAAADTDYAGPPGLRTRGTVLVVPGRGENRATYRRLGLRLAADAYRVRVLDAPAVDADTTASLAGLADALTDAVETVADSAEVVRPLVVVGADAGATAVAALVARGEVTAPWWPDAVVLAGLPAYGATAVAESWDDELDVRTACPVHRGVLTDEARRGSLATGLPDTLLDAAYTDAADLPQLVLVGDADPLADRELLARAWGSRSKSRLSVVRGARHDVLNDVQHRAVAAEVVSFLEALRNDLVPVVAVESSAW